MLPDVLYSYTKEMLFKKEGNISFGELKKIEYDELKYSEEDYDNIIVSISESLSSTLKNGGYIGSDSKLKYLKGQFKEIDFLFAEVTDDENEEFKRFIIIEDKLFKNPEGKRKVIGQVIDYASVIKSYDSTKFIKNGLSHLSEWIQNNSYLINYSCKNNDFLLLIVGDRIRQDLVERIEFLKGQLDIINSIEIVLIEIPIYSLNDQYLFIPHIVGELYSDVKKSITISLKIDNLQIGKTLNDNLMLDYDINTIDLGVETPKNKRVKISLAEILDNMDVEKKNVLEELVRFATDKTSINASIEKRDASNTFIIPNPFKTSQSISLFRIDRDGNIQIARINEGFRNTDIDNQIGIDFADKLSVLFNIPINPNERYGLLKAIPVPELKNKFDQFCSILTDTVYKIRNSANN